MNEINYSGIDFAAIRTEKLRQYALSTMAEFQVAIEEGINLEYAKRRMAWHVSRIKRGEGPDMSYTEACELLALKQQAMI